MHEFSHNNIVYKLKMNKSIQKILERLENQMKKEHRQIFYNTSANDFYKRVRKFLKTKHLYIHFMNKIYIELKSKPLNKKCATKYGVLYKFKNI